VAYSDTPNGLNRQIGLKRLIRRYVRDFQIPENLAHYAEDDLARAQRAYVKFCLTQERSPGMMGSGDRA
jgi:hypothetical protein